jgi:hypothetical protein
VLFQCDGLSMHYRVHSTKVKPGGWYPTKAGAIAAFERACKRKGISPPERYPPGVSGDSITNNDIAYPRHTSAAGMREGHLGLVRGSIVGNNPPLSETEHPRAQLPAAVRTHQLPTNSSDEAKKKGVAVDFRSPERLSGNRTMSYGSESQETGRNG